VIEPAPLLASGRVLDEHGHPLAGAWVEAFASEGSARAGSCASSADGSFQVRGVIAASLLRLSAQAQGRTGSPQVVRAGARDVAIVLEPAAELADAILLDRSFQNALVLVRAVPSAAASDRNREVESALRRDGSFALGGLHAGDYDMSVVFAATALADERGAAIAGGRAFSRLSGDDEAVWVFADRDGERLALLCDGRPLDIAIAAPGFQRVELQRVDTSRRVTLRRSVQVRLRLPPDTALSDPALALAAVLTPCDAGRSCGFVDTIAAEFDAHGELVCDSAFVGALRVDVQLVRRGSWPGATTVESSSPRVIFVADHGGEQVYDMAVDAGSLARALAALASKQ